MHDKEAKYDMVRYKITLIPFYLLNLFFHLLQASVLFSQTPLFAVFTVQREINQASLKKKISLYKPTSIIIFVHFTSVMRGTE